MTEKNHYKSAIAEYRKAIKLKPDYADAHRGLAYALGMTNDDVGAIPEYRKAIKLNPDYAQTYDLLADSLMRSVILKGSSRRFTKRSSSLHKIGSIIPSSGAHLSVKEVCKKH